MNKKEIYLEFNFCNKCNIAYRESFCKDTEDSEFHNHFGFHFDGVQVYSNFINEVEEKELILSIDANDWVLSQSGRRKQV